MKDNKSISKICLLGPKLVGKTSLANYKLTKQFNPDQIATVGIDIVSESVIIEGKKYVFKIYDTAGQERFDSVSSSTMKVSDGFILVFSVDKKETLNKIEKWINDIKENTHIDKKALILIGNKIDVDKREVTLKEGEEMAKKYNMKYFETSAKEGDGIDEAFQFIY